MKKYKYIFDKRTGHFIKKLNEDDTTTNNTETNTQDTLKQEEQKSTHKSVESDELIQLLNAKKTDIEQKFQTNLTTQNKLLDQAKANAAKTSLVKVYDPVATDSNVLNILKKINELKKQYAIDLYNIEEQRLVLLSKLSQANESYYKIPEKYKHLTESNLHTAKIYMKNLVVNDDDHILKGMSDFKRTFKDTNLLYGKDKSGYFVIAIDSEDFDSLTDTLTEVGYLRDEIIDTIVPLVLDRRDMIQ